MSVMVAQMMKQLAEDNRSFVLIYPAYDKVTTASWDK